VGLAGGGILAGLLVVAALRALRSRPGAGRDAGAALALTAAVLYGAAIVAADYYDRYLLLLLPLAAVAAMRVLGRPARAGRAATLVAILAMGALGVFAFGATRDHLSWNRARWDLLRAHPEVPPERLDGGFEVNGWFLYDPDYREEPGRSFWWVRDDEHVLAFGPLPGYSIVDGREFTRWIPPGRGRVLLLRREP
jgi:hypothetical protein